ncbi:oligoendopeptidase, pepF/M3 family [Psychrobacillus sp. OK028]|uniref:M3 family oligoendopeptidase n=1 Tax=Psychrobacillus sp. OK028 TaxID=1884359 RepID=UPI0008874B8B|nr:M3 family oligoendopeptidase [Psychrobacillus sp. OK028]SDN08135.1 oligoendopeptidase, pepF/M3 family [Psychrobacillus sp. OK028]
MEKMVHQKVWNLDNIFYGGSKSLQFLDYIKDLEVLVCDLKTCVKSVAPPFTTNESAKLETIVEYIGEIYVNLSQANSFITCLLSQNTKDQDAASLRGKVAQIESHFEKELSNVKTLLADTKQDLWESLIETKELKNYKFVLNEWRENTVKDLSNEEQNLITDLMADGYHAWGHFYKALVSSIKVNVQVDGEVQILSVGQAINLRAYPNEEVRKNSHNALESIWEEKEELFAKILNHIAGFRLEVYKKTGVKSVLEVPLKENRMKEETINAMWSVINKNKKPFSKYLNRKAEIIGNSSMKAYNFWAPVNNSIQNIQYDEAVELITEHFSQFGTELKGFVKQAFDEAWIEAEDRANKAAIPFCASFPLTGESRVFTTFGGTFLNVLTLVHELGHAFHNYAMKSVNGVNKRYPMSVAETASTFSEMIIFESAMKKAVSKSDKLMILDEKLKRSVMNFMNIHSRFLFEQRFYEERKVGFVSANRLTELMGEAINEAYDGSLDHPSTYSWVWTPHYYITHSPFYNFPYTFGYLFSLSIFAKAKEKGDEFEKDYLNLLRDSGSMTVEDLVMKHLGVDITSEEFWEKGMEICVKDAEEYIKLTSTVDIEQTKDGFLSK